MSKKYNDTSVYRSASLIENVKSEAEKLSRQGQLALLGDTP